MTTAAERTKKRKTRRRGQHRPVTLAEVDAFLGSAVARRYFAFSDSNVKRRLIRMLLFLREEVEKQRPGCTERAAPNWAERVRKAAPFRPAEARDGRRQAERQAEDN